jgi:hypothetical protein
MTDISAFPAIRNVLYAGSNFQTFTATTAVKAGQVVAINATGVSDAVDMAVGTGTPVGVALYDAAAGAKVSVAMDGCWVYVANADDSATIDAGDTLEMNDNAVGGTVNAAALTKSGAVAETFMAVGYAIDDIAASGTGRMKVMCHLATRANTS